MCCRQVRQCALVKRNLLSQRRGADTYFHIVINSKTFVEINTNDLETPLYGRRLAPWCYNRQGAGILNNKNVWSCSLNYAEETRMIALNNNSLVNEFVSGQLKDYILDYTSADDSHFAIVGAPQVPSNVDWKASSFAVSTRCSALQNNACEPGKNLSM